MFLGEVADSRSAAGNVEDESGTTCHLESKEVSKDLEHCVKDQGHLGAQLVKCRLLISAQVMIS